jgi:hypothetical protein
VAGNCGRLRQIVFAFDALPACHAQISIDGTETLRGNPSVKQPESPATIKNRRFKMKNGVPDWLQPPATWTCPAQIHNRCEFELSR